MGQPYQRAHIRYPEQARAAAKASAERWRRGEPAGVLDGVPVTVKENIATAGTPMPLGSAASDLTPAAQNSPTADRLDEAAAILVGKTTMPDYGMSSSGLSSAHGITRNPRNLALNPGGSSSGAGAAAAAGYGPIHYGTDNGGSVRLPACWCGVVGLKPTFGRIPVVPPAAGRTIGSLTRTVADAALATWVAAVPDSRDHTAAPHLPTGWDRSDTPLDLRGIRIGLLTEAGAGLPVEPEIATALTGVAELLELLGAAIEPLEPILTEEMLSGINDLWRVRLWLQLRTLSAQCRDRTPTFLRAWLEGAETLDGTAVYQGFSQLDAMALAADRTFGHVDFLLSPTAPVGAWPVELVARDDNPAQPFRHIGFTVPFNSGGHPAVSMPCGRRADGTAIGVQFAGRRFDDVALLRLAAAFEQARPNRRRGRYRPASAWVAGDDVSEYQLTGI